MAKGRKKKSPTNLASEPDGENTELPPERLPFNEAEWAALGGWWAQGEIERLLCFAGSEAGGYLVVYDLGYTPQTDKIDCELAEREGVRLIFNVEQEPRLETSTPVFEYLLHGNILELKQVHPFTLLDSSLWNLEGTWLRVRLGGN